MIGSSMNKLSADELLYLLYAYSNARGEGTVLQSVVKEALARDKKTLDKKQLEKTVSSIQEKLIELELIEIPKTKGKRLAITDNGIKVLVVNLAETDYEFKTQKGEKLLNTLIHCIRLAMNVEDNSLFEVENFDYDMFLKDFKSLYFEERQRQELDGVVAIRRKDITQKFTQKYNMSDEVFNKYFDKLTADKKIFITASKEDNLIHLAE
ncbi:MAG: hypothetical protein Kow00121_22170 [Elainellaceae cyanobacterium]